MTGMSGVVVLMGVFSLMHMPLRAACYNIITTMAESQEWNIQQHKISTSQEREEKACVPVRQERDK